MKSELWNSGEIFVAVSIVNRHIFYKKIPSCTCLMMVFVSISSRFLFAKWWCEARFVQMNKNFRLISSAKVKRSSVVYDMKTVIITKSQSLVLFRSCASFNVRKGSRIQFSCFAHLATSFSAQMLGKMTSACLYTSVKITITFTNPDFQRRYDQLKTPLQKYNQWPQRRPRSE